MSGPLQITPVSPPLPRFGVKDRVIALIQTALLENNVLEKLVSTSKFNTGFKPLILNLIKKLPDLIGPMLADVNDAELIKGIKQVRDDFIPFLLEGEEPGPAKVDE